MKELQKKCASNIGVSRQQHLAVAFRVQRIAVVIGMAGGIVIGVPPADQAEKIQKYLVQPFRLENRAMAQFVWRCAGKEASNRPVDPQSDKEGNPVFIFQAERTNVKEIFKRSNN